MTFSTLDLRDLCFKVKLESVLFDYKNLLLVKKTGKMWNKLRSYVLCSEKCKWFKNKWSEVSLGLSCRRVRIWPMIHRPCTSWNPFVLIVYVHVIPTLLLDSNIGLLIDWRFLGKFQRWFLAYIECCSVRRVLLNPKQRYFIGILPPNLVRLMTCFQLICSESKW